MEFYRLNICGLKGLVLGGALVGFLNATACSSSTDDMPTRQVNPNFMGDVDAAGAAGALNATPAFGMTDFQSTNSVVPVLNEAPAGSAMGRCLTPTVMFVVDGSGSMCEAFGAGSRWTELRGVLLNETNGLITQLQSRGAFGLMLFDGSLDFALADSLVSPVCAPGLGGGLPGFGAGGTPVGDGCMQVVDVPAVKNNADAIRGAFPMQQLGGTTPTDRAMNQAVDQLIASLAGQDLSENPPYIILATDGAPNDVCVGGMGGDGTAQQLGVVQATQRAWNAGITTFVISLANGDPVLEAHLAEVARAGQPANAAAVPFSPADPAALNKTLLDLLQQAFGCNLG